jgi:hypothetical protein
MCLNTRWSGRPFTKLCLAMRARRLATFCRKSLLLLVGFTPPACDTIRDWRPLDRRHIAVVERERALRCGINAMTFLGAVRWHGDHQEQPVTTDTLPGSAAQAQRAGTRSATAPRDWSIRIFSCPRGVPSPDQYRLYLNCPSNLIALLSCRAASAVIPPAA